MRNTSGLYENWTTGRIADLAPYRENQILTEKMEIEIYTGQLGTSGEHKIFLGYLADDGILRYTPVPHRLEITEQSAVDQARDLFNSTVSADVVQGICIQCHISGWQADGLAIHTFVSASNASHLATNFSQFRNLLQVRGRSYILDKTRGAQGHIGGAVLLPSMQEYKDLDTFLQLLEQAD